MFCFILGQNKLQTIKTIYITKGNFYLKCSQRKQNAYLCTHSESYVGNDIHATQVVVGPHPPCFYTSLCDKWTKNATVLKCV